MTEQHWNLEDRFLIVKEEEDYLWAGYGPYEDSTVIGRGYLDKELNLKIFQDIAEYLKKD